MSIRRDPGSARPAYPPEAQSGAPAYPRDSERIQREDELGKALKAARHLQARLEMLGDRRADVEAMRLLRDSLARDLGRTTVSVQFYDDKPQTAASPSMDRSAS